ncbi:class I SAM-dependent methyltransferase [Dyella japonica]|uniref:Methyltransferase n=1 Tax=Dyella japonica DSM 16301 TaxID=1440762 RepID=A0A0G9H6N9_9GAMM|nr:class I SAM-dependent methyltransferase [Dyella japonica]KLD65233.1 methyltransferase [Dyella japonica DSM 16301]
MRPTVLAVLVALAFPVTAALATPPAPAEVPSYVTAAVNDPARKDDTVNDERRKIADLMAFAEVKPGQSVVDLIPGSGYFTRVFSGIVGPQGKVFAVWPNEYGKEAQSDVQASKALVANPHYANVGVLMVPANQFKTPGKVDLVFTSQNYHDYPDKFMGSVDPVTFDKQVFDSLKPGGLFVVIDHVAESGSGMRDTDTLHRIDPAIVKKQVESVGFVFDGESDVLRNPKDPHNIKVFDKAIRGHTDQFVYRFRKPG